MSLDPVGHHTLDNISRASQFNYWLYQQIRPYVSGEVLEIGSGTGNISRHILAAGHHTTLSDLNEEYLAILNKQFGDQPNLNQILRIDLVHPDFKTEYDPWLGNFDSICMLNVIEHIEDDLTAIRNCQSLLRPGGFLTVLAPAYSWLYCRFDAQLGHHRRYTTASLSGTMADAPMHVVTKKYFNFLGIAGWFFFGKLLNRQMIGGTEMSAFERLVPVARLLDKLTVGRAGLSVIVIAQNPTET